MSLALRSCYNVSDDVAPLPPEIREAYGPFGLPEAADPRRPYISSNFVMGLDGRVSFRERPGQAGGREISRSPEDRWLMDFLRAHHDAVLMGASTLREEPGADAQGWDYAIDHEDLRRYRDEALHLGKLKVIVLTGSGEVDLSLRIFHSARVEPWILTTSDGEERLREAGGSAAVKIVGLRGSRRLDLTAAVRLLRSDHGIRTLLCEGGPTVYAELLNRKLIDEDFRTLSLQVPGKSTDPKIERPTSYGNLSYTPEIAPWFRLIALHYAPPYHLFLRMRYEGART
ncbi:MAG TPA: dihydrofolate reductase family protein [Candidatus Acidoferrales bacterium]|nr:dihydrofolate reductase family protein [Candidatus Acidoferrales bacterium]